MDIFLAGTAVTLAVQLQDRNGNELAAQSVEYRIAKQDGTEVLAKTALAGFVAGSTTATIAVPAGLNSIAAIDPMTITPAQIDSFSPREVRTVELFLNVDGNTIVVLTSYALEPADTLIPGLNSFQSFAQAELSAMEVSGLEAWSGASEHDKINALIDARVSICRLRFNLLGTNINWGQDNLNYVPEGTYPTPYAGAGMFMFNGNLALMTPAQFAKLPPRFVAALRKAQVAEADFLLGGDPLDERRRSGLMLESIGEVRQMYRPGKPVEMPVSKRALKYVSPFISFSKRIGRG